MAASTPAKYAARLTELEALHHELETGKRPGDGAVVVGLLLEAAGDVLRRSKALNATQAALVSPSAQPPGGVGGTGRRAGDGTLNRAHTGSSKP